MFLRDPEKEMSFNKLMGDLATPNNKKTHFDE